MSTSEPKTAPKLNLFDATMIIAGSMIGSGIFIVSAAMARDLQSPGYLLLAWLLTGIMTVFGALSYGELAAAMPKAGGQYYYLQRAYGKLFGFLYGWTLFSVIQTGTIAAVAVAFARFVGYFIPLISESVYMLKIPLGKSDFVITTTQIIAIAVIWLLTTVNFKGVKTGALVQNIFTITKIGALFLIVIAGLFIGLTQENQVNHFVPLFPEKTSDGIVGLIAVAMVGSLFSADAWNNVTFIAGEIQNPRRNLPIALLIGTSTVISLYFLVNVIYVFVLGIDGIANAPEDKVGTALMQAITGSIGGSLMALLIIVSTFGCINGMVLAGARVYQTMALDRLFIPQAAYINPAGAPTKALTAQAIWASLLTLTGSYGDLLDYVMFAVMLFYILTVAAVVVLRTTEPNLERPYKTFAYPLLPFIYLLMATVFCFYLILNKPTYTVFGLGIVLAGVPIYFFLQKQYQNKP